MKITNPQKKSHRPIKTLAQETAALLDFDMMPSAKHEDYRFFPIRNILEKYVWQRPTPPAKNINIETRHLLPNVDSYAIVLVNGVWEQSLSLLPPAHQCLVEETYAQKTAAATQDPFALLNDTNGKRTLSLRALSPVDKPIVILHLMDDKTRHVVSHERTLIHIDGGASITILEKFESAGSVAFQNSVTEIDLKKKSELTYFCLQNSDPLIHVNNTFIHQTDDTKVNAFAMTLAGEATRNNLFIQIDGEHCESRFNGLYMLRNNTIADNHTTVDHRKPNSYSFEKYKGILSDASKAIFNGKILVQPHAQKTNAFQSNRNILLSDKAVVHTKPQLEIWADDVKCSHGCTIGQLDEEALFYLRARGINSVLAKKILVEAFTADVMDKVEQEELRTYFHSLIRQRFDEP